VIASGRGDRLRGLFRHWTNEVRRSRLGLLLRGDELDGDLLGAAVPRRSPSPWAAGRGWLVHDDGIELCQVACRPGPPAARSEIAEARNTTDHTMEDDECA
jgi:S-DNA-T family DNA segregation ATPase FtsK/SpoIIIE